MPPQRQPKGGTSGATHANGTMAIPTEASVGTSVERGRPVNDAAGRKAPAKEKTKKRATSTVDVSKEAASDAKVTGFWSFAGVNVGRMTRYMGSADKRQRKAGYWLVVLTLLGSLATLTIILAAFTAISVYGNKVTALGVGGTFLTTGAGAYVVHRKKKAKKENED
jgi:hypothetical protein